MAPEQRNVFVLFEIERMTGQEASEALSIPLGTVYSRLTLARKTFRQALLRRELGEDSQALRAGGKP
jgi:RNA polymerase sigma-70 factor (ECF subfamily)